MPEFKIGHRWVGDKHPVYFIADIAANHDGDLSRAVALIHLAAEAGAHAAKFQHFRAAKIVSRHGFDGMGGQMSHQSGWQKSVFEVYEDASVPWEWTEALKAACDEAGIDFFSTPYDLAAVDMLNEYMSAYKIGSGDITWTEELEHIARKGKPVLLATGASDLGDVQRAADAILAINPQLSLMQCNTNYTGDTDNFRYLQLNVLRTFSAMYPGVVLGLSDHTPGHSAVLGAVALGARTIEKHFTDDCSRVGPDHAFAMDARAWSEMMERTHELELALGDGNKSVQANERDTVVIQRRCLRAATHIPQGTVLTCEHIDPLRPAPADGIFPYDLPKVLGKAVTHDVKEGDHLRWADLS